MTITTAAALYEALGKCQGGETLDPLDIREPVYIKGGTFKRPVTITGRIEAAGLTGDSDHILRADGATGLHFVGMTILGTHTEDRGNLGRNLFLSCNDMALIRSSVGQSHRGLQAANGAALVVEDNDFHDIRSDGVNLAGIDAAALRRNWYSGFRGQGGDHPDGIQGWSVGVPTDNRNVLIEDELIEGDPAHRPQGIFFTGAHAGFEGMTIRRALLLNVMWQGVQVAACPGVVLEDVRILCVADTISPSNPIVPWIDVPADARISGTEAPRFLVATKAAPVPAGAKAIGTVAPEVVQAARDAWVARFRGASPAPVPSPAPSPSPSPSPSPTPDPGPSPALKAAWEKAWAEQHGITLASRRAETALLNVAELLGVAKP